MAAIQSPPTFAPVVLVDEKTGRASFNPIWLRWFVDLVGSIEGANHELLTGLLGGAVGTGHWHLTAAELSSVQNGAFQNLSAAKTFCPPKETAVAQTDVHLYGGLGAPNNANGANGDFYFRSDGGAGTRIYFKTGGAWTGIV